MASICLGPNELMVFIVHQLGGDDPQGMSTDSVNNQV